MSNVIGLHAEGSTHMRYADCPTVTVSIDAIGEWTTTCVVTGFEPERRVNELAESGVAT